MHYVIIGNSASGINAAEAIRNQDKTGQTTIISDEATVPYSRCLLSYYLAGELPKQRLFIRDKNWYQSLNITPLLGRRVISLRPKKNLVVLDNRKQLHYDKLLIATGSSPLMLPIKGANAQGIFGLRTIADANNIIRFMSKKSVDPDIRRGGSAIVLGGGFIGLKTAYGLWKQKLKVTVIEKLNHLMPRMIDQKASAIFQKEFKSKGINIISGIGAQEIITRDGVVTGVRLANGQRILCQILIMSVGVKPNIGFLTKSGIKTDQGIIVNEYLQTNIKDIFAAGDVAETIDFISGERTINALWSCASAQGKIAGYNMTCQKLDKKRRYTGSMAMNAVEFFRLPVISFGVVNPEGNGYKTIVKYNHQTKTYQKLILQENRLVGLILVGKIEKAGVFLSLLKRKDDLGMLKNLSTLSP